MRRSITMLVLLTFILTILSPYSVLASESKEALATDAALEYMNARRNMLSSGNPESLSAIAVSGIVADEIKHREHLFDHNLSLPNVTYSVDSVNAWDNYAIVKLREVPVDDVSQNNLWETVHILRILFGESENTLVISDNYYELFSGFESCSYVPEYLNHTRAFNEPYSTKCFTYIANKEVGYLEKASNSQLDSKTANPGSANYTKYGAWYGANPAEWCAMFVSWCANQAGVPTTVIPKESWVPTMASFFQNQGLYYASAAAGGNYIPEVGDIFFTTGYNHTGIVYAVGSTHIQIIDGNSGNQVQKDWISLTDSSLLGFASPNIAKKEHTWIGESMLEYCRYCGAQRNYLQ